MSATPTLTFYCPACSSRLTVPANLAGVTGPCPTCGTVIQAPIPTNPPPSYPVQVPSAPVSSPSPAAPQSPAPAPQPQIPPARTESSPTVVRVEPRSQPARAAGTPQVAARPMPEPHPEEQTEYHYPAPAHRARSNRGYRVLISLAVLAAMAGIALGLINYLSAPGGTPSNPGSPKTVEILPKTPIPKPGDLPPPRSLTPPPPSEPSPPAPQPPSSAENTDPAPTPAPPPKPHPGVAAAAVLEKFLAAQTLAERLPLIESKLSPQELETTVLARPFPTEPRISPDIQENNRAENYTDIYYNVDLKGPDGKYKPYLILLRAHGGGEPKILADPLLDTYGGRLLAFATTPSDQFGTFQIVASAVAKATSDQKVPNYEQKLWLKLLPRDNEKEIASAYFTKLSRIGKMLVDDASGFRYGQAKPVRVVLRWNKEEDPAMPYLEAVEIKELRWNP